MIGSFNSVPVNSSDAAFRAWGSAVSAVFATVGMVQTTDTGQINWATVLAPPGINVSQGYEIWRFNDALQSTAPIFFKIEYGASIINVQSPGFWFTFGTGSNGTGGLTGPISARFSLTTGNSGSSATSYYSGDVNRVHMSLWVVGAGASTTTAWYLSIERTKDVVGGDTSVGLLVTWKATTGTTATSWAQLFWNATTGTPANGSETSLGAMSNSGPTGKNGLQIAVYPFFLNNTGIFVNPPLGTLAYVNGDIAAFGAIAFTIYGSPHTYLPIGSGLFTGAGILARTTGTPSIMMRYE